MSGTISGLELNHLRYFQAVVVAGSLTAAARVLRVSQPTLTVAIRTLEERLGTTLLLRGPRGVEVTATGEELLRHVLVVFETLEEAQRRIHGLEEEEVGSFTLGCHESLGAYFLPGFMGPFLARWPRIQLTLWNATSAQVRQAVVDQEIPFGLVVNPDPHPDLVMVDLYEDNVDLFVAARLLPPPEAPEAERLARVEALLRRGPLVFAGRVLQSQQIIDRLAEQDRLPGRMLRCGDFELVKSLTLGGVGVGILPRRVAAYGYGGELRSLGPGLPLIPDRIFLLFRSDMHRTRGARCLKEALIDYGRSLNGQPPTSF